MKPILDMLQLVEDVQLQDKLLSIYEKNEDLLLTLPASLRHHHVYVQGLYDHTQQVMHLAIRIFNNLRQMGPLGCTQDDVITVSFISSLDRLERFQATAKGEETIFSEKSDVMVSPRMLIVKVTGKFGLNLEDKHLHAITFMTGGWKENEFEYVGEAVNVSSLAAILRSAKELSINCFPFATSIVEEEL